MKMGYRYVRPWRSSFHALLVACKTPISASFFSSQNPTFIPTLQIFEKFDAQKPQNWQRVQFQNFKLGQTSVHKASFCQEIQFTRIPKCGSGPSTSPFVRLFGRAFGPHTYYLNESRAPPPHRQDVRLWRTLKPEGTQTSVSSRVVTNETKKMIFYDGHGHCVHSQRLLPLHGKRA